MSYTGLLCLLIKSAEFPQGEVPTMEYGPLAGALAGGILGGGAGLLGGGVHGFMTAPDEVDPETGQMKSKWDKAWNSAKNYGMLGAGFGALGGGYAGLKASNAGKEHGFNTARWAGGDDAGYKYLTNWHMPNMYNKLNSVSQQAPQTHPGYNDITLPKNQYFRASE